MAQPLPTQPDPDLQSGLQFLRAGMFDRAEPLFRSAYGRYGDRPEILHYLAVCLFPDSTTGKPHTALGMLSSLTVGQGGAR